MIGIYRKLWQRDVSNIIEKAAELDLDENGWRWFNFYLDLAITGPFKPAVASDKSLERELSKYPGLK